MGEWAEGGCEHPWTTSGCICVSISIRTHILATYRVSGLERESVRHSKISNIPSLSPKSLAPLFLQFCLLRGQHLAATSKAVETNLPATLKRGCDLLHLHIVPGKTRHTKMRTLGSKVLHRGDRAEPRPPDCRGDSALHLLQDAASQARGRE